MLLFTPFKQLRDRFFVDFRPFTATKTTHFARQGRRFLGFTIFSSHSLFALSSGLLRPIFGSSGHLLASSRAHFSWPKLPPPAQKGRLRNTPPPFLTYMCPSSPPTSQMVPPEPQNDPKTYPNPPQNAPQRPQIRCPPSYFIVIPPSCFSTTQSYLVSTAY